MAKKKKADKIGRKKQNTWMWIAGAAAVVVLILFVSGKIPTGKSEVKKNSFTVQGGETRPVLDPSRFTGMTRSAYAAAKAYPQVLDQVYCYCYCDDPPFNHKSLLSCFAETHGAG